MYHSKLKLIIMGDPKTKKNSQQIFKGKSGKPFITQSQAYKDYAERFIWQVPPKAKLGINCPVNVKCVYYRETKRRVDLTNLLSATHDLLVESGVLADDNFKIVISVDGSRVMHDKDSPRVEIEITEEVTD